MTQYDYDLFVIGAGSGGVRAARIASQHGAKVAVAEDYRVGGTCVIRGCVPKKLFVYASHYSEAFEDAVGFGWTTEKVSFDWPTLVENKDKEIDRLNKAYIRNLEASGAELIMARAVFEDRHTVALADGRRISARYVLIATGAAPFVPLHLPGRELAITSNEAFHLERLPQRICIVGGGYIAVEFAGIFNNLGVETILIYRGEKILRGFDEDLRDHLTKEMKKKGIELRTGCDVVKIECSGSGVRVTCNDDAVFGAGQIMYATGRIPNVMGLNLEKVGVELTPHYAVKVDAYSRSSVENIYAVGDVTNRLNLTPVAIREGHAFADTVFGGRNIAVDIGYPYQDANPSLDALSHLDLIEVAGRIVVDGRPQPGPQVFQPPIGQGSRPGGEHGQFRLNVGREIRIETLGDHFLAGSCREIKSDMSHETRSYHEPCPACGPPAVPLFELFQ